jgi:hypothetical protein
MHHPIAIDHLTEAELMDLNHRVVTRLKFLHEMKLHARMLDFSVGERVSFQPDGHPVLFATIIKYNRKTVTLITDGGQQWNVAPTFLRKLTDMGQTAAADRAGPEKGRSLDSGQPLARRQCIQTGGEP